jgi:hypothetical protein
VKRRGTKLCCCLAYLGWKGQAYMYHKMTTNGTNVSKCCWIYFWTPCYRPGGQEDPSNSMTARTPVCTSYSVVIGQTSCTLQADIEIWGLSRLHLFWGLLTRRAKTNCSTRLRRGAYLDGYPIGCKPFASLSSTLGDLNGARGRIFWSASRTLVKGPCLLAVHSPTTCGAVRDASVNTCSGCDNWPVRTLLATLPVCADL